MNLGECLSSAQINSLAGEYEIRIYNEFIKSGHQFLSQNPTQNELVIGGETLVPRYDVIDKSLEALQQHLDSHQNRSKGELLREDFLRIEIVVQSISESVGVDATLLKDNEQANFNDFCRNLLRAELRAIRKYRTDFSLDSVLEQTPLNTLDYAVVMMGQGTGKLTKPVNQICFGELLNRFNQSSENQEAHSSSGKEWKVTYQKFYTDIIGYETPLSDITTDTSRAILDVLRNLPSNATKHYPGKSYKQIYEIETRKRSELPRLSALTAKSYFAYYRTLFKWAKRERHVPEVPYNDNMRVRCDKLRKPPRKPFALNELEVLLLNEEFNRARLTLRKAHQYWVPIIALFTGMRRSELLFLLVSDVRLGEIPSFDIQPNEARSVKNQQSIRDFPIPQILIELGFLDYVKILRREKQIALFPYLTGKDPPDAFGKWFAYFLRKLGIKQDGLVFHSTRHNFKDGSRFAELDPFNMKVANQIGGWKSKDICEGYGGGYSLSKQKQIIDRLTLDGMAKACELAKLGQKRCI